MQRTINFLRLTSGQFLSYLHLFLQQTDSVPDAQYYKYEEIQLKKKKDNAASLRLMKPILSLEEHSRSPELGSWIDKPPH